MLFFMISNRPCTIPVESKKRVKCSGDPLSTEIVSSGSSLYVVVRHCKSSSSCLAMFVFTPWNIIQFQVMQYVLMYANPSCPSCPYPVLYSWALPNIPRTAPVRITSADPSGRGLASKKAEIKARRFARRDKVTKLQSPVASSLTVSGSAQGGEAEEDMSPAQSLEALIRRSEVVSADIVRTEKALADLNADEEKTSEDSGWEHRQRLREMTISWRIIKPKNDPMLMSYHALTCDWYLNTSMDISKFVL